MEERIRILLKAQPPEPKPKNNRARQKKTGILSSLPISPNLSQSLRISRNLSQSLPISPNLWQSLPISRNLISRNLS
eukprot:1349194-Amorphochlora_amoeboformis.AAC.1